MRRLSKYRIFFVATVALSFLLLANFGVLHSSMMMQPDGQMSGCPFMGEGAICQMNPLEHLAAWQNAFTTTIPGKDLASLLLLLLLSLLVLQIFRRNFVRDKDSSVQLFRVRYRERLFFLDPLQEAFSNGILNPKLF